MHAQFSGMLVLLLLHQTTNTQGSWRGGCLSNLLAEDQRRQQAGAAACCVSTVLWLTHTSCAQNGSLWWPARQLGSGYRWALLSLLLQQTTRQDCAVAHQLHATLQGMGRVGASDVEVYCVECTAFECLSQPISACHCLLGGVPCC